ncbi:hypothetical protein FMUND_10002 [Fusarium mundagurra]|uniref:Uncharacterized protein n=1 Tax=Fusarium mundagurra TaxID=1567541 RepID=A0A8H6DAE0_9HYPO|nr:hypothetical protein FMUND_10002 [Fusarium mundagurra]
MTLHPNQQLKFPCQQRPYRNYGFLLKTQSPTETCYRAGHYERSDNSSGWYYLRSRLSFPDQLTTAADGPQPTNTQAPESDDIDAGPVEATSDLRHDSSSESARPPAETCTSQPVPDPTIDAEQPQPGEIGKSSSKPLDSGRNLRQTVSVPQLTEDASPPSAPMPLKVNVSQALGVIVPCLYEQVSAYKSLHGDTITAYDYGNVVVISSVG